jgi:hypothetical protein
MSKAKLVEKLVNEHGYDPHSLETLEEEQLNNLVSCEQDEVLADDLDDVFGTADVIDSDEEQVLVSVEDSEDIRSSEVPEYTSPSWGQYVLDQFTEEELFDGNPVLDGLRRVAELLLGDILESTTQVVQTPTPDNGERATAIAKVVINVNYADRAVIKVYSGSADAYPGNIAPGFEKYPVALAETRAEARALRKALRLRTVAHEELGAGGGQEVVVKTEGTKALSTEQAKVISFIAKGNNVNVEKLLTHLGTTGVIVYNNVKSLSDSDGKEICRVLSAYQADRTTIPEGIIGYSEDWRK